MTTKTANLLDSCVFLTAKDRAVLVKHKLTDPDAVLGLSEATLVQITKIDLGTIGRLRRAAEKADQSTSPAPAIAVHVTTAEPLTRDERLQKALRANPPNYEVLGELGVAYVVAPKKTLDADATHEMLRAGLERIPPTWKGKKVVALSDLAGIVRYRNPRNRSELQGLGTTGVDEVTNEPWGELGLDGLCVTAYGEQSGFFAGMTNAAVLAEMRLGAAGERSPLRASVEQRMADTDTTLKMMEDCVVVNMKSRGVGGHGTGKPFTLSGTNFHRNLEALFDSFFDTNQLHRFLRELPDGDRMVGNLSNGGSPSSTRYEAVDMIRRYGIPHQRLRRALEDERPRRLADIAMVFDRCGV